MTIEERAKEYAISVCDYKPQNGVAWDIATKDAYIRGANDQRKIDEEKALKVYEDLMTCSGYFPETITAELARMRNKLED